MVRMESKKTFFFCCIPGTWLLTLFRRLVGYTLPIRTALKQKLRSAAASDNNTETFCS